MKTREAIKEAKKMLKCFEAFSHLTEVLEDIEHREYLLQGAIARYEKLHIRSAELQAEIEYLEANLVEIVERGKLLIVDQDARLKNKTDEITKQIKDVSVSLFIAKQAASNEYRKSEIAHKTTIEALKNEEARLSKSVELLSKKFEGVKK